MTEDLRSQPPDVAAVLVVIEQAVSARPPWIGRVRTEPRIKAARAPLPGEAGFRDESRIERAVVCHTVGIVAAQAIDQSPQRNRHALHDDVACERARQAALAFA